MMRKQSESRRRSVLVVAALLAGCGEVPVQAGDPAGPGTGAGELQLLCAAERQTQAVNNVAKRLADIKWFQVVAAQPPDRPTWLRSEWFERAKTVNETVKLEDLPVGLTKFTVRATDANYGDLSAGPAEAVAEIQSGKQSRIQVSLELLDGWGPNGDVQVKTDVVPGQYIGPDAIDKQIKVGSEGGPAGWLGAR